MGAAMYIVVLGLALTITYRVGLVYHRTLRRNMNVGLVGFDPELTERYARHPSQALREAAFTRAFKLVFSKQGDPEVERARRKYALCVVATAAFTLFGLGLL